MPPTSSALRACRCQPRRIVRLRLRRAGAATGQVEIGGLRLPCAIGRGGRRAIKREGDGATPRGPLAIRRVLYRRDRTARPRTGLPVGIIRPHDGWCDAPGDANYNRPVRHPYPASAERMWREDALYDIVVVLGHNDRPRARNCGSAIFMHLARPGYTPTEGCIALSGEHLRRLLARLGPRSIVV